MTIQLSTTPNNNGEVWSIRVEGEGHPTDEALQVIHVFRPLVSAITFWRGVIRHKIL